MHGLSELGIEATPAVATLTGALLLAFGRRLFWLFVGVIGFVIGFHVAVSYLDADGLGLLLAVGVGVLAGLAAIFVQKLAVTLAGFAAGALGLLWLAEGLGWSIGLATALAALVAGIAAAALVRSLFELGLVVLSSLAGAALVVEGVRLDSTLSTLLFVALAGVGISLQLVVLHRRQRPEKPQTPKKPERREEPEA